MAIDSPRVPRVIDHRVEGNQRFVVTPFLGQSLPDYYGENHASPSFALLVTEHVAEALVAAHALGIAHRDIKPNNVVVRASANGSPEAFLIDFGICQWDDRGVFSTVVDEAFGNAAFAAPECFLGSPVKEGLPSDIYSLGKLLYWLATGGGHIDRERITDDKLDVTVQETGVEAAHIGRLLKSIVTEDPNTRCDAAEALRRIREASRLSKYGTSPPGSKDQLCLACRSGSLRREENMHNMGYANVSPHLQRILRCPTCGYIQHYMIDGTARREDWEF